MPPVPDWRSAAAYAYLDDLKPAELAWEFLRRNSDYRRDYRAVAEVGGQAEFPEPLILRWGLPFSRSIRTYGRIAPQSSGCRISIPAPFSLRRPPGISEMRAILPRSSGCSNAARLMATIG